jgi:hypothetical protein
MAIKVKEIKDDALLNISVNKSFYLMSKALSFYLFTKVNVEDKDQYLKDLMTKEYQDLDDLQRSIYTVILLLAEIERQATETNQFEEKEITEDSIKQD